MEKMLVTIFDDEKKAYEASRVLDKLDAEGDISLYAEAVLAKNNDGTVTMKKAFDDLPVRTMTGTAIGSLVGLLGGPIGFAVGMSAGTLAGAASDVYVSDVDDDFLMDVSSKLTKGKYAVVADVSEEWVTPVDTKMEELGGTVFRTSRKNWEAEKRAIDIATAKAEKEQLKLEKAQAHADRKAKIQHRIDSLQAKVEAKSSKMHERLNMMKKERDAKIQTLEVKRKTATADSRARIDARIEEIKRQHEEAQKQYKREVADQLEQRAETLRKESS